MINRDAKWLVENTENSVERQHILAILWDSISRRYPDIFEQSNSEDEEVFNPNRIHVGGKII